MEKRLMFLLIILLLIFSLNLINSAEIQDSLHLNIQTTNTSGDVVTGTFNFVFNISNSSDCASVVYSNSTTLTTDSRGIISYYLENTNLDYDQQYWLCYYRNGSLINSSRIARTPYAFTARNTSLSGIEIDVNLNMGSYNVTSTGSGFFTRLGSLLNRISALFVQNIDFSGSISGTGNITTTGRIGIGTTTPQNPLNVIGDVNITGDLFLGNGINISTWMYNQTTPAINWANDTINTNNASWTSTYNATYDTWAYNQTIPAINTILGFNYYNLSDFDINDYYLNTNPYAFYNSTTLQNVSQLANNNQYWNSTFALFNKTYADTLYANTTWAYNQTIPAINTILGFNYYNSTSLQNLTQLNNNLGIGNWTQDKPNYYNTTQVNAINTSMTNYVNAQDLAYNNTMTNYVVATNTSMKNYVDALNVTQANWVTSNFYGITNPYAFYNSTTLQNVSQLANNNQYWNSTFALFNKTYADTLYANTTWAYNQTIPAINTILGFNYYNLSDFDINDYYLASNPFNFYNSTSLQNISQLANNLGFYNQTTLQNISQLANNLGYYNITTLTMSEIQNKGFYNTTQVDVSISNANTSLANYLNSNFYNITQVNTINTSMTNYVNALNVTQANWVIANYYNKSDVTANISAANTSLVNWVTNNYANLSTFDNASIIRAWNTSWITNNVGNWTLDKPSYYNTTQVNAINTSMTGYVNYVNGTMKTYVDQLNATGLIKDWNSTGFIKNWNSTGYIKNWTVDINSANTSMANFVTATNTSMANYVNALNVTQANWVITNYYNKSYIDNSLALNDSLQNYVPYTGATQNINLGIYNLSTTGSLGIGTSTPTQKLSVVGNANITGTLYSGDAEFNGGWTEGGVSIVNGSVYANSAYFYNITGLEVNTLKINGSLLPATGFDNTFDLGNSSLRWNDLYLGGNAYVNGTIYQGTNQVLDSRYNSLSNFTNNLGIGNWTLDKPNYYNTTQVNAINTSMTNYVNYVNGTMKTYVDQLNATGLIKDWNSTGFIKNWNATGYIKNWTVDINSANTSMANYVVATNTSMTNYVNALNVTQANWVTSNYYNKTDVTANISAANASLVNWVTNNYANLSTFDNSSIIRSWNTSWITNNVGNWTQDKSNYYNTTQVNAINTSMTNYVNYVNGTMKTYVDAQDVLFNNSIKSYTDALNVTQANWVIANYYNKTQVDSNLTNYYVPYTGSNKNVALGDYNFSVGTSDLFVNSNTGNVGIGTTNTGAKLHITSDNGGGIPLIIERYNLPGTIIFKTANGNVTNPTSTIKDDQLFAIGARGYGTTGFAAGGRAAMFAGASENWTDSSQGTFIAFTTTQNGSTSAQERMRIENTGNVGIGTTSPSSKLEVAGNVNVTQNFTVGSATVFTDVTGNMIFRV